MSLDAAGILTKLIDHAATLGVYDYIQGHAVISPPASGLALAFEFANLVPGASVSGLASTSVVLTWTAATYHTMQSQPADDIEIAIVGGASQLLESYSGDFDLGGVIRNVDLLGQTGRGLSADGGYIKIDEQEYRTVIVTIPMIVNDVYTQVS